MYEAAKTIEHNNFVLNFDPSGNFDHGYPYRHEGHATIIVFRRNGELVRSSRDCERPNARTKGAHVEWVSVLE